ncbi:hypothetical protein GCM10007876_09080 [Litoribrevibacter albus]|uniref:Fatty acid hydroxylase domain-containing protein n=2 Tax=Litoribrevibacter albus TaxID=1473156 RepID=A0AA37W5B8_9GAMM|nr:hypothetical protein GCM10007876_09080 [Litoribrevibacter albus]
MGFVALVGVTFIYHQFSRVESFNWQHGLGLIGTLMLWNFIEYFVHIQLGHKKKKLSAMFYKRHTGDHHTFFTEQLLVPQSHKDWRVTLFPAWLVLVTGLISVGIGHIIALFSAPEWGYVFSAGLMMGYLAYEFFHFCDHLPDNHLLVQLPWIGHMRQLHRLHHRRELMQTKNFNLTFPLADWVMGTFYWESPKTYTKEAMQNKYSAK